MQVQVLTPDRSIPHGTQQSVVQGIALETVAASEHAGRTPASIGTTVSGLGWPLHEPNGKASGALASGAASLARPASTASLRVSLEEAMSAARSAFTDASVVASVPSVLEEVSVAAPSCPGAPPLPPVPLATSGPASVARFSGDDPHADRASVIASVALTVERFHPQLCRISVGNDDTAAARVRQIRRRETRAVARRRRAG